MIGSESAIERTRDRGAAPAREGAGAVSAAGRHSFKMVVAGIFVLALALRLWFNFGDCHVNNAGSCDGSEYLRNARALSLLVKQPPQFFRDCLEVLCGAEGEDLRRSLAPVFGKFKDYGQSGPVFPLFIFLCWALTGSPMELSSWQAPLMVQSIFSAVTCLFIALLGRRAFSPAVGMAAGFIAALYPAFIVNSGRLYTESFAVSLTVFSLWLISCTVDEKKRGLLHYATLGFSLGLLQLTRSVMCLLTLASYLISMFKEKGWRRLIVAGALTIGLSVSICPWLVMQKVLFDRASVVVDRVGNYNLFIGTNTQTAGWLSYPYPDGSGIEAMPLPELAWKNLKQDPVRWLKLMLDKPVRLLKHPWNDFFTSIGPVTFAVQVVFHQSLLILSAVGLFISFGDGRQRAASRPARLTRLLLLAFFASHLIYCAFITVPRYNLTAMPGLIVFAAAGLVFMGGLLKDRARLFPGLMLLSSALFLLLLARISPSQVVPYVSEPRLYLLLVSLTKAVSLFCFAVFLYRCLDVSTSSRKSLKLAVIGAFAALLPFVCLPIYAQGRFWQGRLELSPGSEIERVIPLTKSAPGKTYFLAVDLLGTEALSNGDIVLSVDGHPLSGPFIPGISLIQDFARVNNIRSHQIGLECEWIFDAMSFSAGLSNSDLRQWFFVPVPEDVISGAAAKGKLTASLKARSKNRSVSYFAGRSSSSGNLLIPSLSRYSWEKMFYGVENDEGMSDGRYEEKIKVAEGVLTPHIFLVETGLRVERASRSPLAQRTMSDEESDKAEYVENVAVPASFGENELWLLRLKGEAVRDEGEPVFAVDVSLLGADAKTGEDYRYQSLWTPRLIDARPGAGRVDTVFPVKPGSLPGKPNWANVRFYYGGPYIAKVINMKKPKGKGRLEDFELELVKLSQNPLSSVSAVF